MLGPRWRGRRLPTTIVDDLLATMAISGLSRVRTELFELTVIQVLAPHPVQVNRQLSGHRYLRDLPSSAQDEVEELAAPVPLAACCDLGRFDQQIAKQGVALFDDHSRSRHS